MVKAVVLGAAGGIGQPLSLLLKNNPLVTSLSLYDIVNAPGVAVDLSHINTPAKVEGFLPPNEGLKRALEGAEVVVIPAGVPRKPGINAGIVRDLATGIATTAPKAFVLVISNPVNSTVPIVVEVFKKHGVFDPKRIFGVTTLDVVRASTFAAEAVKDASLAAKLVVPVYGGHSGVTILPVFSQAKPALPASFLENKETLEAITHRVRYGGDEVVKAKDGAGSATLSMAYAGASFVEKVLRAVTGEKGVIAPTFVYLEADPVGGAEIKKEIGGDVAYFSVNVELGPTGVEKILPIGKVTEYEKSLFPGALTELETNIKTGASFIDGAKL
ncbi:malate dehydrogenase [Calocera cornea HHB12733]|uniref:malate dehydrogenase n=1 Tax=Calocera cornea HHB12733 TaxID=1353952 RepID=A0A165DNN1_9BASI|nr:malate dehydrogenase [Calocera cornea HHB12733]